MHCNWTLHIFVVFRHSNLIFFILLFSGLYTSQNHDESLCNEENFQERTWTTQGRIAVEDPTPYPIIGEYTGVIPDTDGLCAKLYSDCNNPEIMFYTIFNCFNRSEVYEGKNFSKSIKMNALKSREKWMGTFKFWVLYVLSQFGWLMGD